MIISAKAISVTKPEPEILALPNTSSPGKVQPAIADPTALDWVVAFLNFLSDVIWPVLIACILLIAIQKKCRTILANGFDKLTLALKTFKFGSVEVELRDADIKAQLETEPDSTSEIQDDDSSDERPKEEPLVAPSDAETHTDVEKPISSLTGSLFESPSLHLDPRIIALQAYSNLETELAKIASSYLAQTRSDDKANLQAHHKNLQNSGMPLQASLNVLKNHGVLKPHDLNMLRPLREIRNEIAHNVDRVEMTRETARSYSQRCKYVLEMITSRVEQAKDLDS